MTEIMEYGEQPRPGNMTSGPVELPELPICVQDVLNGAREDRIQNRPWLKDPNLKSQPEPEIPTPAH